VPRFETKVIEVVKTPGRWVRECINGVCRERWVPPVMEMIDVRANLDPIDERAVVKYHWQWGLGSCGMIGCVVHGAQRVLVDDQGNPAPPGAIASENQDSGRGAACSGAGQGRAFGWRLRRLFGR
jgi:hypothetical protein